MPTTRPPAVAGLFYPSDPTELTETVDDLLAAAPEPTEYVRAIIAPHAGYIYSGPTAAFAHRALDPKTRRVLILGPTHRVGIEGMALTGADYQGTPLGLVPTDPELTATLESLPDVITAPIVHAQEHSLEVHLPFLQRHLEPGFTVVPIAVGHASPESVARVIEAALALPDTAVVVSSDLSHFLPYDVARRVDADTIAQILQKGPALHGEQACGAYPVSGLMRYAADHGWEGSVLDVRNSGDTAGDRSRVVGYPAIAWAPARTEAGAANQTDAGEGVAVEQEAGSQTDDAGEGDARTLEAPSVLPVLAYNAIARELGQPLLDVPDRRSLPAPSATPSPNDATDGDGGYGDGGGALSDPGATFVTLTIGGQLRGCIGSLVAHRPLGQDVVANAVSAAFRDPRFPPLSTEEFEDVDVEVSQLTAPQPLWEAGDAPSEPAALDMLRPHVDGVVIQYGNHRATFLPQVWDQLPDPVEFMTHLKAKAGLPANFWSRNIQVQTYQVSEHHLGRDYSGRDAADVPAEGGLGTPGATGDAPDTPSPETPSPNWTGA